MVQEQYRKGKKYYFCEKCGFGYQTLGTAHECEDYCSKNNKCSREITQNALFR